MYISKLTISNFRNFRNSEILFNDGINVIIGHNNAGKTNLLKALGLVINYQGIKRLEVDDFSKHIPVEELKDHPPTIKIELIISESECEDLNSDDLVTVGNWLTKLESPYEAMLTYEFFLPERMVDRYKEAVENSTTCDEIWKIISQDFIRYYTYKIFCGNPINQTSADGESLEKFDFQFLDAIRNVERDMLSGKNTLLRDVFHFFMDYDIKNDDSKNEEAKRDELKTKKQNFSAKADELLKDLQERMGEGKKHILSYVEQTGASFNKANPDFEGSISDVEMFSALRLIVKYETGIDIKIPATHNGLGYNNLIFMSLLLAKMQVNSDGKYLDSNAKVFPILAIEEPEAHLHPAMQYKFLKFLRENKEKKVRQIFVTTHSTQITSAVLLDEIICLHEESGNLTIGYPGKCFTNDEDGIRSKEYVQRFLDATKSDMLFAQKVILVEGISVQLLLPILAKYVGFSLEDYHIAIINVGGRHFDYFLNIFDSNKGNTISKKIVCLTDRDPEGKPKADKEFRKCYPFEFSMDTVNFDYKENASTKILEFETHPNIRFFSQDFEKGKTFEYELMFVNPKFKSLLTDSISNKNEIEELMTFFSANENVDKFTEKLRDSAENRRIAQNINKSGWTDEDKKKSILAARYLNSVGKGGNALELSFVLEENLINHGRHLFQVPKYIKDAIEWICQ